MHRFASLPLKSRIDARSSPSSARTTSTDPQHAFHHALKTRLALDVCMGAGTTPVRQWRQKRVLMRPEAAFPYVFAAEGAQHPPKKPPRSMSPPPRPTPPAHPRPTPQLIPRPTPQPTPQPTSQPTPQLTLRHTSQPHPIPHPAATAAAGVQSFSALCA